MPTGRISTVEEAEDLIRGLTVLGTGGGGTMDEAREYLYPHVRAGVPVSWVDLGDVSEQAVVCCTFGMGSIAPKRLMPQEERASYGYGDLNPEERPFADAVRELTRMTGQRIDVLVSFEIGAGNTGGPLDAAVRLGLRIVDGDLAGRAIPKLTQTTAGIYGIDVCPLAISDGWGNRIFVRRTHSLAVAERIGKSISTVSHFTGTYTPCAHAGFTMTGQTLRRVVIPGTISHALDVGRAIRLARERGHDPLQAAARALGGWVCFIGVVTDKSWESRDGYMVGEAMVEGREGFSSRHLRVWYQNENHMAWLDGRPYVTSPDLIMILQRASGEPIINTDLSTGDQVGVLAARSHPLLRTSAALAALGPRHFGFDVDYVPVEARLGGPV